MPAVVTARSVISSQGPYPPSWYRSSASRGRSTACSRAAEDTIRWPCAASRSVTDPPQLTCLTGPGMQSRGMVSTL